MEEFVYFAGAKSRDWIYKNLCNYDLYIQPSLSEGFGLTIAEAMAAKVPVIVSNLEGPMEVISQGQLGCYFESGNYIDLANKIEEYFNKKKNTQQIEDAYTYTKEHYDVKKTAKRYLVEYQKVIHT